MAYCKRWTGLVLDWTLDWTLDWILDWTLDLIFFYFGLFLSFLKFSSLRACSYSSATAVYSTNSMAILCVSTVVLQIKSLLAMSRSIPITVDSSEEDSDISFAK